MVRYGLALALLALALTQPDWPLWLRFKLGLFAGVIGCGLLIRFQLIRHFTVWGEVLAQGSTPEREASLRATYRRATSILGCLWLQVFVIAVLAVVRPF